MAKSIPIIMTTVGLPPIWILWFCVRFKPQLKNLFKIYYINIFMTNSLLTIITLYEFFLEFSSWMTAKRPFSTLLTIRTVTLQSETTHSQKGLRCLAVIYHSWRNLHIPMDWIIHLNIRLTEIHTHEYL